MAVPAIAAAGGLGPLLRTAQSERAALPLRAHCLRALVAVARFPGAAFHARLVAAGALSVLPHIGCDARLERGSAEAARVSGLARDAMVAMGGSLDHDQGAWFVFGVAAPCGAASLPAHGRWRKPPPRAPPSHRCASLWRPHLTPLSAPPPPSTPCPPARPPP